MAQDIIMPQMGESLAEGTITKWLKQVGDPVERDEPLFEISTDKVDAEIPSPGDGVLVEIKVGEGETVEVNTVVGVLGAAGEVSAASPAPAADAAPAAAPEPPPAPAPSAGAPTPSAEVPAPAPAGTAPTPAAEASPARPAAPAPVPSGDLPAEELRRLRSSPVVRKIAAEHGIDIGHVPGTGVAGRVTKKDLLGFIESGGRAAATPAAIPAPAAPAPAPAAEAAPGTPAATPATTATSAPATPAAPGRPAAPTPSAPAGDAVHIPNLRIPPYVEGEPVTIEPMTIMRKKIAEHMVYSRAVAAHVTSFFDVDFEAVAVQRRRLKAGYAEKGVNLTYMPFVIRAVVDGLQNFPYLNASVMGENIVFKREINIGIAVALAEGKGLIVPVIRGADEFNLLGLARTVNDLGERARTKKLSPDEVQRGTFSITNPGVYGGLGGTPIINQPQVAILGVGAIEKRPVVVNDAIAIRHRCYLSLSYDHRVVDGAMAEMFMAHVKKFLEAGSIG